jgi:HK97 gp10 family phage protein
MDLKYKIEGGKELAELLKKLPDKVEKNFMRQAVRAGAAVVVKDARNRVPKRTGNLSKSIGTVSRKTRGGKVGVSIKARQGKERENDGFYGRFIERGTVYIAARPFLRPALKNNVPAIISAMAKKLNAALEKFVSKYGT